MTRSLIGLLALVVVLAAGVRFGVEGALGWGSSHRQRRPARSSSSQALSAVAGDALSRKDSVAAAAATSSVAGSWLSNFSTRNFAQWSWWGQGQADIWGDISVVDPRSVGIPALNSADPYVARMTVARDGPREGKINAKLYKAFTTTSASGVQSSPANVSGTYSAWYFIPSDFSVPKGTWSNIFQFKEQYALSGGGSHSDPLWWVQLGNGHWADTFPHARWLTARPDRDDQPVAVLNFWGNRWTRKVVFDAVPLNQWFEISAVLRQDHSITFSINGRPFDTALASQHPVSPFHSDSQAWDFGAGNYSTAPGNTLYVGQATYVPAT